MLRPDCTFLIIHGNKIVLGYLLFDISVDLSVSFSKLHSFVILESRSSITSLKGIELFLVDVLDNHCGTKSNLLIYVRRILILVWSLQTRVVKLSSSMTLRVGHVILFYFITFTLYSFDTYVVFTKNSYLQIESSFKYKTLGVVSPLPRSSIPKPLY